MTLLATFSEIQLFHPIAFKILKNDYDEHNQ